MFKRLACSALVIIAAIGSPGLIAHIVATSGDWTTTLGNDLHDDGWRLTKDGWERMWPRVVPVRPALHPQMRATAAKGSNQIAIGLDIHPLLLSLLLSAGAVGPFFMFRRRIPNR